jgi:hypothetical protein
MRETCHFCGETYRNENMSDCPHRGGECCWRCWTITSPSALERKMKAHKGPVHTPDLFVVRPTCLTGRGFRFPTDLWGVRRGGSFASYPFVHLVDERVTARHRLAKGSNDVNLQGVSIRTGAIEDGLTIGVSDVAAIDAVSGAKHVYWVHTLVGHLPKSAPRSGVLHHRPRARSIHRGQTKCA